MQAILIDSDKRSDRTHEIDILSTIAIVIVIVMPELLNSLYVF